MVHTAYTNQLEVLCIVWQSNSSGENEILLQGSSWDLGCVSLGEVTCMYFLHRSAWMHGLALVYHFSAFILPRWFRGWILKHITEKKSFVSSVLQFAKYFFLYVVEATDICIFCGHKLTGSWTRNSDIKREKRVGNLIGSRKKEEFDLYLDRRVDRQPQVIVVLSNSCWFCNVFISFHIARLKQVFLKNRSSSSA